MHAEVVGVGGHQADDGVRRQLDEEVALEDDDARFRDGYRHRFLSVALWQGALGLRFQVQVRFAGQLPSDYFEVMLAGSTLEPATKFVGSRPVRIRRETPRTIDRVIALELTPVTVHLCVGLHSKLRSGVQVITATIEIFSSAEHLFPDRHDDGFMQVGSTFNLIIQTILKKLPTCSCGSLRRLISVLYGLTVNVPALRHSVASKLRLLRDVCVGGLLPWSFSRNMACSLAIPAILALEFWRQARPRGLQQL